MEILDLTQGSPQWLAHRRQHFNASDAPAMLGISPHKTRSELLRELATGLSAEPDAGQQYRFDAGHRAEALARPLAEQIIGEELSPLVGADGRFSASFDGLTMMGEAAFEHKLLNQRLRQAFQEVCFGADLPDDYQVQMEHQAMVAGTLDRILFMASEWDMDGNLVEEKHCWYYPNQALRSRIIAGWNQFEIDLANYKPEPAAAPTPTGRAPQTLPALRLEMTGAVTASNLDDFKAGALAVLAGINRTLETDQDFADAEETCKWCGDVEQRIKAAKDNALAQTASIEAAFRVLDDVSAEVRRVRLDLEKLVKTEKEARRMAIVTKAIQALKDHTNALNERIGMHYMPLVSADFAGAIKGKKNLDSMKNAVATELARAKAEANQIAERIEINLKLIAGAPDTVGFQDAATLVLKDSDDLRAIIANRIAETERIFAAALAAAQQRKADEERAKSEAAAAQARQAPAPVPPALPQAGLLIPSASATATAAANDPLPDTAPTLKLGAIAERLGFSLTADQLRGMGIHPAGKERSATLYHEVQFPAICDVLIQRISQARQAHNQRLAA